MDINQIQYSNKNIINQHKNRKIANYHLLDIVPQRRNRGTHNIIDEIVGETHSSKSKKAGKDVEISAIGRTFLPQRPLFHFNTFKFKSNKISNIERIGNELTPKITYVQNEKSNLKNIITGVCEIFSLAAKKIIKFVK